MITLLKIKQLERKFAQSPKGESFIVWHEISEDGRLLDKNGLVMTKEEVKVIEKEDQEVQKRGGNVWFEKSCYPPKLKKDSTTIPYFIKALDLT